MVLLLSAPSSVSAEGDGLDELRLQIIEAMETGERLDISEYRLNREEMEDIYSDLFHRGLLPWYADYFCDWTSASDGTIAVISLRDLRKRSFSEDDYERAMAELIAETCHEGMTDLQKALSVHDYIVAHAQYSYLDTTNNGYHALVKGETACYGYAQLYLRVMDRLGIPCQIVICDDTGDGVGHAWNVVSIDGNWYHLDLTWDDPLPEEQGRAMHTYFLKTDREFRGVLHHNFDWKPDIGCDDKTFASGNLWDGVSSPIIFLDAETALLRRQDSKGSAIYAVDPQTGEEQLLHSVSDSYSSGLSWWNERVWFNADDSIYSMKPDGTDVKTEYIHNSGEEGTFLCGFQVDDGVLRLSLIRFLDGDYRTSEETVELTDIQYHAHAYEASYVSATCEEGGYTLKSCTCGISYQIDKSDPEGHELAEEVVDGVRRQYCRNCDYVHEDQTVPTGTAPAPSEPAPERPIAWGVIGASAILAVIAITAGMVLRRPRRKIESKS